MSSINIDSNKIESAPEQHVYLKYDRSFDKRPKHFKSVLDAIGCTPMVRLNSIPQKAGIKCEIYAKCEFVNPGGSVKDRIALKMIEALKGELTEQSVIVEPTSGNTGIGVALVAALKGYKSVIVMPDDVSDDKKDTLNLLGAKTVLCPTGAPHDSNDSVYNTAKRIAETTANAVLIDQFSDEQNPLAHKEGTAEEILWSMDGQVDMVVMGVGSGGTITGVASKIKEKCPECVVVGVDPVGSIFAVPDSLNIHKGQFHEVEGIGGDSIPQVLNRKLVHKWVKTEDKPSLEMARRLCKEEGLLCGGSSGAAMCAAIRVAKNLQPHQKCVVILADGIRNYMTKFVTDEWMESRGFQDIAPNSSLWWWDRPMPTTTDPSVYRELRSISYHTAVKEVLKMLHNDGGPVIAVTDDYGCISGVISAEYVRRKMNRIAQSDLNYVELEKITIKRFCKVNLTNPPMLGLISRMLDIEPFVVVVQSDQGKEYPKGYITTKDILGYIISH